MYDKEREVVIMLSRYSDILNHAETARELMLSQNLNWNIIVKYLCKTKTMGLFWRNITLLEMKLIIPVNARRIMSFYYEGNVERNKVIMEELEQLLNIFKVNGISIAPLKGSKLLEKIYVDLGSRQLNDIDLLVSKSDIEKLEIVLTGLGYKHGKLTYDSNGKLSVLDMDRFEQIVWKTKMNNLPPMYKILNNRWCEVIDIDCCFSFDYQMRFDEVDEKIRQLGENSDLDSSDFFIHLCCHLYKEASNASWALLGSDLNLIKFCDVREYFNLEVNAECWKKICKKAKAGGYAKAIYFSLFYIEEIYKEKCKVLYKEDLGLTNDDFLVNYGEREFEEVQTWKEAFIDRLFEGSKDEINIAKGNFPLLY